MKRTLALVVAIVLILACAATAFASSRYVTKSVNFRTGAGRQYKSIRVLSAGTKVEKLGPTKKVKTKNATSTWVKVKYKGKTGWICAGYLSSSKPAAKSSSSAPAAAVTDAAKSDAPAASEAPVFD